MTRNRPFYETSLIRQARETLENLLPADWVIAVEPGGKTGPDATLKLTGPDGQEAWLAVQAKRRVDPKSLARILDSLRKRGQSDVLIISEYLSPTSRERLTNSNTNFIDQTGNVRLAIRRPSVFLETRGSNRNPFRVSGQLNSLKGFSSGRVVRALCDFRPPYGIRELAERSRCSPATVTRVVQVLEREALVEREPQGRILGVSVQGTIRRWCQDYSFARSNLVRGYLAPRGIGALLVAVREIDAQYALTGVQAAPWGANVVESNLGQIYAEDADELARELQLKPAETAVNVQIAEPFDRVVFERTRTTNGLVRVAATQAAADLLTGPGRGPVEGEGLLDWMDKNEEAWRE